MNYEEYKAKRNAERQSGIKTAGQSTQQGTAPKVESYEDYKNRRNSERNTIKSQSSVNADYIDGFFADMSKFLGGMVQDQQIGHWDYMTNPFTVKERNQKMLDLAVRSKNVRQWFHQNREYMDDETYSQYVSYLDALDSDMGAASKYYSSLKDYASQEEYKAAVKRSDWQRQYMDTDMLLQAQQLEQLQQNGGSQAMIDDAQKKIRSSAGSTDLSRVEQRMKELTGTIQTAKGKGQDTTVLDQEYADLSNYRSWILNNKYVGQYEGMSYADLQSAIDTQERFVANAGHLDESIWAKNNTTLEKEQEKLAWLKQYAPTRKTGQDHIRENEEMIADLQADLQVLDSLGKTDWDKERQYAEQLREKYSIPENVGNVSEWLKEQSWYLQNANKFNYLSENADFDSLSQYNEATGEKDQLYRVINSPAENNVWQDAIYAKYINMEPYEIRIYNYVYATQGKAAAKEYLRTIEPSLDARLQEEWSERIEAEVENNPAVGLLSAPADWITGIPTFLERAGKTLWKEGKELVTGQYQGPVSMSSLGTMTGTLGSNLSSATTQYIQEEYENLHFNFDEQKNPKLAAIFNGHGLSDVYQLTNAGIQIGLQMITGKFIMSLGGSKQLASGLTAMMSSGSAASTVAFETVARGGTDEQALMMGLSAGLFEWLFEKYEVSELLSQTNKSALTATLKNALSEGVGESATTLANTLADTIIMQDLSQFNAMVQQYVDQGMSPEEAEKTAWISLAANVTWDGFMGAISGGFAGGTKGVYNSVQNNRAAKAVFGQHVPVIVDQVLAQDPENKLALDIKEKLDKGKTVSGAQISKLVQADPKTVAQVLQNGTAAKAGTAPEATQQPTATPVADTSVPSAQAFTGKSGTTWNQQQAALLAAIPDAVLQQTEQKLGKVFATFDIVGLENDAAAQQAWKRAGLTWEQLGNTYVNIDALKDEIAHRKTVPLQAVETTQPAVPTDEAARTIAWAKQTYESGGMSREDYEGMVAAAQQYAQSTPQQPTAGTNTPQTVTQQPVSGTNAPQSGTQQSVPAATQPAPVAAQVPGKVRLAHGFVKFTPAQWAEAQRIAEITGKSIVLFNEPATENGIHDGYEKDGVLYINTFSPNPMATIFGHECLHSFEGTKEHERLKKFVINRINRQGGSMENLRREKRNFYKQNGVNFTYDANGRQKVDNEIVAAYVGRNLFDNEQSIRDVVEYDPSIGQRIMRWIDGMLGLFGNKNAAERNFLHNAKLLYQKALNNQLSGTVQKSAAQTVNTDSYDFTAERQRIQQDYAAGKLDDAAYDEAMAALDEEELLQEGRQQQEDQKQRKKKTAAQTSDNGAKHSYSNVTEVEAKDIAVSPEDGSLVVNISSRAAGLQKYPKGQWAKRLAATIKSNLAGKSIFAADGDIITVTNRGISELTYGKRTQDLFHHGKESGDFSDLNEKQIASEHVASLIALSKYESWSKNNDPNDSFKKDGLCHRTVTAYFDGIPHKVSILTALNGDYNQSSDYGEKFYDIESIEEIEHQTSRSALNGTGTKVQASPHKIKMADGMSDRLTVAQKNRIVNNQNRSYSVGDGGGKSALQLAYEKAQQQKDINHSFSPVSEAEDGGAQTEDAADVEVTRENLPAKARNYLIRAENDLRSNIEKALSVPKGVSRESLKPIIQQISDEYLRTGTISQETIDRLFNEAYDRGVVEDREFYDQYKHIKDHLRTTAITISQQDQSDIADFKDFRIRARYLLRIKDDGGLPVDSEYQELHSMAPELFPENITHPADQFQKMYEVAKSIEVIERSLDEAHPYDAAEFKSWAKNDFESAVWDSVGNLRDVKRYALDRMADHDAQPITTPEQAVEAWAKLKEARRTADKAMAKNLLTESDQQKVGQLLRGEITLDMLDPASDNVKGITAVYEAKQEYEALSHQLAAYKRSIKAKYRQLAESFLETITQWKDKGSGFAYSRETMWRNIQDVVPDPELAKAINEEYFFAVNRAEARATKLKNDYRNRVRGLNLSRKVADGNLVSEAHAVQLYGEAVDNIRVLEKSRWLKTRDGKSLEEWRAVVQNLWAENPNLDQTKIQKAVEEFRKIYDELFQQMNEVRVRNGYESVNYRSGYFPHFQPGEEGVIAQFGKVFGIEQVDVLPTTINGLTHMFRPGTQWFGNAQERIGFNTAYDALEGFDKYIEGIAGVIHQTDNIQKLRAFASQIRYMASDDGVREQVDAVYADTRLTDEEKNVQIAAIYEKAKFALSKFVEELDEYTNLLANKKSRLDRTVEGMFNRKIYNFMRKWEGRVAANMVGGNLGSALTNLIPLTQAWGRISSGNMLKGMAGTLKAYRVGDGIDGMSDFLTNRHGSDPVVRNWIQATSNALGKPMEIIDNFVSGSIVRAAYYQNKARGMSDAEAIHQADLMAVSIMADRSKGAMPTLFSSLNPIVKNFTQFQLEVNNQLSEVVKDIPRAYRDKTKFALVAAYTKYFVGAFLFNALYQLLLGRKPALDPIDMLLGVAEDIEEEKELAEILKEFGTDVLENLPFTSGLAIFGVQVDGGRLPVSSSIPDLLGIFEGVSEGDWSQVWDEVQKPITYGVSPFGGGGQISKSWKGIAAFIKGGSYTKDKDGNDVLQYPVYKDQPGDFVGNMLRSAFFGKYSTPESQEWVDSGFQSLSAKDTAIYQDLLDADVTDREAYGIIKELRGVVGQGGTNAEKSKDKKAQQLQIIKDLDVSGDARAILYYGVLATDKECEMMDRLADVGSDADHIVDLMISMKEVEKDKQKWNVLLESDIDTDGKEVVIESILGTDMETEKGNPSQYAKFLDMLDRGMTVNAYLDFRSQDGDAEKYLKFADAGLHPDLCDDLSIAIGKLEPEEGKKQVSDQQKWQTVIQTVDDKEQQMAALLALMTDGQYAKLSVAHENQVSPELWVVMREILPKYDKDENGRYSGEEIKYAINGFAGDMGSRIMAECLGIDIANRYRTIDPKQKAVLWQLLSSSKSGDSNPFNKHIGNKVQKAYDDLRESQKEA